MTSRSGRACACAEGSAEVALRMAAELGARVRLDAVVPRIDVAPGRRAR